jgi:hypothetical protein
MLSKNVDGKIVNLLYYEDHYFCIKNFNRLLGSDRSYYHHFCIRCLSGFLSEDKLKKHYENCLYFEPTKIVLPNANERILKFSDYSLTIELPYVAYCDFETLTTPEDINKSLKTKYYQKHIPNSFCLLIVDYNDNVVYNQLFRGPNPMKKFLCSLKIVSQKIFKIMKTVKEMNELTEEQKLSHQNATHCYICEEDLQDSPDIKVYDHNHLTGNYRGPSHASCNLNFQTKIELPVFIHNLKNFDSNLILKSLTNEDFRSCEIIPQNFEKFISFSLYNNQEGKIKFLDSYNFLSSALSTLTDNLAKVGENEF